MAGRCYLYGSQWSKEIEIGAEINGLYLLTSTLLVKPSIAEYASLIAQSSIVESTHLVAHVSNSDIWHARIGHVHANILKLLHVTYKNSLPEVCDSCYFAE